jgi:hypothetical protein
MGRMVGDPETVSNQGLHSGLGPHITWEAEGLGSLDSSFRGWSLCADDIRGIAPGVAGGANLLSLPLATLQLLADRPLGYSQSLSNFPLLPTFLMEFPGPQAPTLRPMVA